MGDWLEYTHGFTRLWPTMTTVVCMALSFMLLAHALKTLPIGTAYAVWTGIGTAGPPSWDCASSRNL